MLDGSAIKKPVRVNFSQISTEFGFRKGKLGRMEFKTKLQAIGHKKSATTQ